MRKTAQGFTLVELLVVIAIVAILAAAVVLIINPLELTKRSRDATRLADMANLQQAINVAVQESTSGSNILCNGDANGACTGDSSADTRVSNGTGWVKVNLSTAKSVSVPTLPVDPLNTGTNIYAYGTNGGVGVAATAWEINCVLESQQYATGANNKMSTDGGNNDTVYEVGSDLSILN